MASIFFPDFNTALPEPNPGQLPQSNTLTSAFEGILGAANDVAKSYEDLQVTRSMAENTASNLESLGRSEEAEFIRQQGRQSTLNPFDTESNSQFRNQMTQMLNNSTKAVRNEELQLKMEESRRIDAMARLRQSGQNALALEDARSVNDVIQGNQKFGNSLGLLNAADENRTASDTIDFNRDVTQAETTQENRLELQSNANTADFANTLLRNDAKTRASTKEYLDDVRGISNLSRAIATGNIQDMSDVVDGVREFFNDNDDQDLADLMTRIDSLRDVGADGALEEDRIKSLRLTEQEFARKIRQIADRGVGILSGRRGQAINQATQNPGVQVGQGVSLSPVGQGSQGNQSTAVQDAFDQVKS